MSAGTGGGMSDDYDDLLPVSFFITKDLTYLLLDRHNDVLATFEPSRESEDCQRLVDLINHEAN